MTTPLQPKPEPAHQLVLEKTFRRAFTDYFEKAMQEVAYRKPTKTRWAYALAYYEKDWGAILNSTLAAAADLFICAGPAEVPALLFHWGEQVVHVRLRMQSGEVSKWR